MTIYGLKVLDRNMCSCNGGTMQWKLNKWFAVKGKIKICNNGLHLTFHPKEWNGTRIFICETPKIYNLYDQSENKAVCRKMRLLKELTRTELEAYGKAEKQASDAYGKAEKQAWDAYWKAKKQALGAYWKAKKQALEAYGKAEKQAWDAYWKKMQSVLTRLLEN